MVRHYKGLDRPAEARPLQGREGESDVDAAGGRLGIVAAASGDDHVRTAGEGVGPGRGVAGEGERGLPKQGAGGFVEGAELFVKAGGADEDETAGGDDRSAIIFRAGIFHSLGGEFWKFAELDVPEVFAGFAADGVKRAPGRRDVGIARPIGT